MKVRVVSVFKYAVVFLCLLSIVNHVKGDDDDDNDDSDDDVEVQMGDPKYADYKKCKFYDPERKMHYDLSALSSTK